MRCWNYLLKVFVLCHALFAGDTWAQSNQIDSLEQALTEQTGEARTKTLNDLAWAYKKSDFERSLDYGYQALRSAIKYEQDTAIIQAHTRLGLTYLEIAENDSTLHHITEAYDLAVEINDSIALAHTHNEFGLYYEEISNYQKALQEYHHALEIMETSGNLSNLGNTLHNIGKVHYNMSDFEKSLEYFERAQAEHEKKGNRYLQSNTLMGIGAVYVSMFEYEKAKETMLEVFELKKEFNDITGQAMTMNNIAIITFQMGDPDGALVYMKESLELHKATGYKKGVATQNRNIGEVYREMDRPREAIPFFLDAIEVYVETEQMHDEEETRYLLSQCYAKEGDFTNAWKHISLAWEQRDSVFAMNKQQLMEEMSAKYESDRKELEIQNLNNANALQTAELELKDSEIKQKQAENDRQAAESRRKDQFVIGIAIVLVLVLGLAVVAFRAFKRKQKANEIISRQKEEAELQRALLAEKNTEILDSIQYAKRLQEAILPPLRLVKKWLPESFVIYQPKDIVAGDFYWMEVVDDVVYFAAADCTGHGVPGAMVSVVCSNALTKSLVEERISEPARILDRARELVIERFQRSEDTVKDGMDISLCAWDSKAGKLQWAGANNPLWILRKGADTIEETKADKQPIGMHRESRPFTNHVVHLNSGDTIYMCTDGFQDQFGGERGKKYKSIRLKQRLSLLSTHVLSDQAEMLEKDFETWRGDIEQVDDVCMIGVRV